MKLSTFACVILCAAAFWGGCSSTTQPQQQSYPSKMTFTKGESTKYQTYTLDTMPGEPRVGNYTTTTSTLIQVDQPVLGKTAQIELNVDSTGATVDSGYYSQDAGSNDLYAMGFGVSQTFKILNSLGAAVGFALPDPGWVLVVKMGASKGTSWNAYDYSTSQTVPISGFSVNVTVHVTDVANEQADTTFALNGKTYGVKHATHLFSLTASAPLVGTLASFSKTMDYYSSGDLGTMVVSVLHPNDPPTISAALAGVLPVMIPNKKMAGSVEVLVSHQ